MKVIFAVVALFCAYAAAHPKSKSKLAPAVHVLPKAPTCSYAGQRFPDEYECNAYFECSGDVPPVPQHHYCGAGYSFSYISLSCIPYDTNQCGTSVTGSPPAPTSVYPVDCTFKSQIIPSPDDCAVYYLCDSYFIPQYFHCSPTLIYDPTYAGCNFIERVACDQATGYRPTPLPTAIPGTDIPGGTPPVCTTPGSLYGDYQYCEYFWKCSSINEPEPFKCPPQLLFDHFTNACDLAATANCVVRHDADD